MRTSLHLRRARRERKKALRQKNAADIAELYRLDPSLRDAEGNYFDNFVDGR